MPLFQVLVVDDYEPLRRFVCGTLATRSDLQIVGEASDGLDAVLKAAELRPDLIVLDIGLPSLSGIEAARRIRRLSPASKILFLSQESSADVVQEAFSVGGLGYVVKSNAGRELMAAVDAVCAGRQFVSAGVAGAWTRQESARLPGESTPASQAAGKTKRQHEFQFYGDEASLVLGFTGFIEARLRVGNAVIVLATAPHQESLLSRLQERFPNVRSAIEEGRYISVDVAQTLATFMEDGLPDPVRFWKTMGSLLAAASGASKGERRRVAACGECSPVLLKLGKADGAIRLEHLWDEVAMRFDVDTLCGYLTESLNGQPESDRNDIYRRICAEHSEVSSNDRPTNSFLCKKR